MANESESSRPHRTSRRSVRDDRSGASRDAILVAALAEFGAKGYSGARTASIAAQAGVNQQLISYYFGGKQGLLDELHRRWADAEAAMAPQDKPFLDAVRGYVDATLDRPDWAKLVVWRALGDAPGDCADLAVAQRGRARARLDRIRCRQASGELRDDLDPAFVLLVAYAIAFAPIALADVVEELFGVPASSPEYRARCLDQLRRIVAPRESEDYPAISAGSSG
jgi:AcrR family transcriptional regulator